MTKDEKRKKPPPLPFPPLLVAQQSQQVEAARQSKRPRTADNAFQLRFLPCVCWDTLDQSSWYNVVKFVAPAPPENIFMNLYVHGCLQNDSLHDCGMPRPLRGRLKHGGRSALVCEGQLPLLGSVDMTVGSSAREEYFIWIRDISGLVEASMLWNFHRNSYGTPSANCFGRAWSIIGYDLQKWKVKGNNVHRTTCHPIPPLCKMISEICYSFPLVRYKYCLFADIDIDLDSLETSFFRFSTSDVAEQSIDVRQRI